MTSLRLEVVWVASITLHERLKHTEPWEICTQGCGEDVAGNVVLAALEEIERIGGLTVAQCEESSLDYLQEDLPC